MNHYNDYEEGWFVGCACSSMKGKVSVGVRAVPDEHGVLWMI